MISEGENKLTVRFDIQQILVGIEVNGPRALFSPRARKLVILFNPGISFIEKGNSVRFVPFGHVSINCDAFVVSTEHIDVTGFCKKIISINKKINISKKCVCR